MIRIALVGQPNSGKSTIFNHLVGYRANTSNLPGTYSLTSLDLAEAETRNFLLKGEVDAVLNVIDASLPSS
jgi:ferrous iron transport protein B